MDNLALLIVLASFVCLVVGLIKPSSFNSVFGKNATRKFLSIFFGSLVFVFFIIFGISSDTKRESKTLLKEEVTKDENVTATSPVNKEDRIKEIIKNELDGENNNDKSYLRDVDVFMDDGEASIVINYNADENITTNLTKVSLESRMSKLYYTLYQSALPIKSVRICGYLTLTDKYGNHSDEIVYTTGLDKDESSKINWINDESEIKNGLCI